MKNDDIERLQKSTSRLNTIVSDEVLKLDIELNKIKKVLVALWNNHRDTDTVDIMVGFTQDLDNIERGE